jgi:hypothetical protein
MGRLPQGWIAPPAVREVRELVRHRAKLVAWRSQPPRHTGLPPCPASSFGFMRYGASLAG